MPLFYVISKEDIVIYQNFLNVKLQVFFFCEIQRIRLDEYAYIVKFNFEIHLRRVRSFIILFLNFSFFRSCLERRQHLSVEVGNESKNRLLSVVNCEVV